MLVKLSEILESLESGGRPKGGASLDTNGIPSLGAEHLDNNGGFNLKSIKYIPESFFRELKNGIIEKENILIVKDGATTGKVSFVSEDFPFEKASVNEHVFLLKIDKSKVSPKFVFFYLKNPQGQKEIMRDFRGATVGGISRGFVEYVKIELLPLPDQLHIANILTKAENLISQRKESIRLLDEFLKSTFLEMFHNSPDTLDWDEVKFEELADKEKGGMRTGPFGSSLLHGEFTETGDVKVLGIDNVVKNRFDWKKNRCITNEKYQQLKRYTVYPHDVLISIMATLGRTAVVPADIPLCINSKHLAAITLNKEIANPYYIAFAFHSHPHIVRQLSNSTKGAIMDGLNLTIIRNLKINLPPIVLQNRFAKIFIKTEALKTRYQQSLQELENLYGSLSQRAFRGELQLESKSRK